MAIRVMVQVWDVPFATASMKLVALKLADCANEDGENIWPSNQTIERQTQLSRAAVFAHLADLDASGLCVVIERKRKKARGKEKGKTRGTVRQFDQDVMNGLASGALRWAQVEVSTKSGTRPAWRIFPADQVQSLDSNDGDQSPIAGLTSPMAGLNESNGRTRYIAEPSFNRHSPAKRARESDRNSDLSEGWATAWTAAARAAVDEVRTSATASHVADVFLDAVRGVLGPHKGADPAAFVRQVSNRLREFSPAVLAELAEREISNRSQFLSAAGDLAKIAQVLVAKQATPAALSTVAAPADPELALAWSKILDSLAARIGPERVRIVFGMVAPVRATRDRIVMSAPAYMIADVRDRHGRDLLDACRQAGFSHFEVEAARAATRAA